MTWYVRSREIIQRQRREVAGKTHAEQRLFCVRNYPFSMRSGYAYKAWLDAMRDEFGRARRDRSAERAGQIDFVDQNPP